MIGAGLALTSKTVRDRAAEATAPVIGSVGEMLDDVAERAQGLGSDAKDRLASARSQANVMARDAQDTAAGAVDALRSRAAQATSTVGDKLRSGMDVVKDTAGGQGRSGHSAAKSSPRHRRQCRADCWPRDRDRRDHRRGFPRDRAEAKAMGRASDSVKQAAAEGAQSGFEAARDATMSAADAAAKSVSEADLGSHASRMTQNMADTVKEAADDVLEFNLQSFPNPEHLKEKPS